jgi:Protein of unknown function (DUF3631)
MTEEIPAYAAVALAGLGWLPDTILSRSVVIRMRRRHQGEQVEQFRRRIHLAKGERIRFLIQGWARLADIELTPPDKLPAQIQDRDADVWESLITIADAVGGDWPERARVAAVTLVAASKEVKPSLGIRLLADLRTVFGSRNRMTTKEVLQALNGLDEAPWGDIRGKPLDERGLARRLKQYSIKSKTLNIGGDDRAKGYDRADLHDTWTRYLPSPLSPDTSVTSVTGVTKPDIQTKKGTDVTDRAEKVTDTPQKNGNGNSGVAEVTDVTQLSAHRRRCAQCGAIDDGKLRQEGGSYSTPNAGGSGTAGRNDDRASKRRRQTDFTYALEEVT